MRKLPRSQPMLISSFGTQLMILKKFGMPTMDELKQEVSNMLKIEKVE